MLVETKLGKVTVYTQKVLVERPNGDTEADRKGRNADISDGYCDADPSELARVPCGFSPDRLAHRYLEEAIQYSFQLSIVSVVSR